MLLVLETLGLCLLFFILCWLGTGTDEKNLKSFRSYPDAVQKMLRQDPVLGKKIRETSQAAVFVSNVVLFSLVLLPFGLSLRGQGFSENFLNILIMGEAINGFDLIMDLCWFRNSRRTRFTGTKDEKELYRNPENHVSAFLRGMAAFLAVALVDGLILSLF